ncbi:MAG: mechanosensitive ion channel [Oscillatoriales cyanobacterium SM2_2_1]|nr:mechanosensitive ion channel [Oscillatoriales cyanobacterium SM2_2_1]
MGEVFRYVGQFMTTPILDLGGNPISIASIFSILFMLALVVFGAQILCSWLQRAVLSRLGINRGLQEVVKVTSKYLIIAIGAVTVLQSAGINLNSLAVFASVVGIGVGFGLQNLASNFFSGLIIVFEQTIKVGDYVEVGSLRGTIERISIRSTIVRTPDDVFVIVPNQKFIQDNTVNWSYGGQTCRLHIPVLVAYDSDPVNVTEALLTAARLEPRVLSFPAADVWMRTFEDNGILYELLVWVDQPPLQEPIKSSLNFRIEYELRQRHIEIPYPQRVVHIKSSDHHKLMPSPIATPPDPQTSAPLRPLGKTSSRPSLRDLLRRMSYFETCSESEMLALVASGYRKVFRTGEVICREGEPSDAFYIILHGQVEVISERTNVYITTLHDGEFFGEIALLTGTPRTATVRTLVDTTLFVIERLQLQTLLVQHHELAEQIAAKLSERKQMLLELGVIVPDNGEPSEKDVLWWVRDRLNALFGIQW